LAITDKDIDTIDQYVNGLLSRDDLVKFERRLEQEDAIALQVVSMKALRHSAKASVLRDKMKMLQQWDAGMGEVEASGSGQEEDKEVNQEAAKVKKISWLKYAAVVAVLIGVVYAGKLWMDGVELERLEKKYAGVEFPESPLERTRSTTAEDSISPGYRKAFDIYDLALIELENENYSEADRYFKMAKELLQELSEEERNEMLIIYIDVISKIK